MNPKGDVNELLVAVNDPEEAPEEGAEGAIDTEVLEEIEEEAVFAVFVALPSVIVALPFGAFVVKREMLFIELLFDEKPKEPRGDMVSSPERKVADIEEVRFRRIRLLLKPVATLGLATLDTLAAPPFDPVDPLTTVIACGLGKSALLKRILKSACEGTEDKLEEELVLNIEPKEWREFPSRVMELMPGEDMDGENGACEFPKACDPICGELRERRKLLELE